MSLVTRYGVDTVVAYISEQCGFTPPEQELAIRRAARALGLPLTKIARATRAPAAPSARTLAIVALPKEVYLKHLAATSGSALVLGNAQVRALIDRSYVDPEPTSDMDTELLDIVRLRARASVVSL